MSQLTSNQSKQTKCFCLNFSPYEQGSNRSSKILEQTYKKINELKISGVDLDLVIQSQSWLQNLLTQWSFPFMWFG